MSILVKPVFYIGLAVGLPVFSIILTRVQTVLSLQEGHIKKLAGQIVYLAFSLFVSLIS